MNGTDTGMAPAAGAGGGPPSQDSLLGLVSHLGGVEMAVLAVLVYFSIVCWGIFFYKRRELRRAAKQSERFLEVFWEAKNLATIHTAMTPSTA